MTVSDLIAAVEKLYPFATFVPKGTEIIIYLGKPLGYIRVLSDGRLAWKGIIPSALTDILLEY